MRKYNPNPKHESPGAPGRRGTRLDISAQEADRLLNDAAQCFEVPGKKACVGVRNGKIYVFLPDNSGGYHAYPASGNDVYTKYPAIAPRVAGLLGIDIQRLSRLR
jgi:hypothetical protein